MKDIKLRQLQEELKDWTTHNFGEPSEEKAYRSLLGAMEELGELAHAHLKEEQGIRVTEDYVADAQDSCADVVIFIMDYCNQRSWDFETILYNVWNHVVLRDWKADPEKGASE